MTAMKPVDLYIRISRIGGRENLMSDADQEKIGREFAKQRGLTVGEILKDLDESGGKWDRPGLQRGLERVQRGESGGMIVAWLDRLSRDSEHAHRLIREIGDAGGAIYAPDAPADWTTPEGELQAGIVFAFAQYVRKRARAGFERAKRNAINNGIPINTRPAVGFRARADRRLEPDPDAAPIVREVFERRGAGAGPSELAEFLEWRGVTTSQGSKTWSKQAVYGMLSNRVYLGELSYGKDRRFVNVAAHEPIVDLVTWQMAQGGTGRTWARAHLLSGLLRCNGCRHAMQGTADSHRRTIYRCTRRHAGGMCEAPARIRADRVEAAILDDMRAHLPKARAKGTRAASTRLAELKQSVIKERAALAQWASPEVQAEVGDLSIYVTGLRERRERVAAAEAALEAEQGLHDAAQGFPTALTWERLWAGWSVEDRAGFLARRYDCIRLGRNPDILVVYPRGVGPLDLPRRGFRREPVLRPFEVDLPDGARVVAF